MIITKFIFIYSEEFQKMTIYDFHSRHPNLSIEGGDILRINKHFIIGLSDRTNKEGAENLSYLLTSLGATVDISSTPKDILHFKTDCSLIDDHTILITKKLKKKLNIFKKKYNIIEVPEGEEIAANSIRINDHLLIPEGFKKTEDLLSKNYNLILLKVLIFKNDDKF